MRTLIALLTLLFGGASLAANAYVEINSLPTTFNATKDAQAIQVNVPGTLTLGGCNHGADYGRIVYLVNANAFASPPNFYVISDPTGIPVPFQHDYPYLLVCTSSGWWSQ